jgi:hypothetical protein
LEAFSTFASICGLEQLWRQHSLRRAPLARSDQRDRMLLDLLGLGLEQALQFLGSKCPSFEAFVEWTVETAGMPDPVGVARYHAWLDGAPLPRAIQAQHAAIEAMPPVLDAADLAHWASQGWVRVRQAISPGEASAAADLLWSRVGGVREDPTSWYGARRQGIMVQQFQHPAQDAVRHSPRLHKAFAQLWGTADLWVSIDRMSFNPPETEIHPFRASPLHWDVSLVLPIPFATQGIVYLTDTEPNQGALQVVPAFHHRIEDWLTKLGDCDPRSVDLSSEAITIGGAAGDLVIWRQDLPHGASANCNNQPRLAQYANRYSPNLRSQSVWR